MKAVLSPEEIRALQAVLPTLSPREKAELLADLEERAARASKTIGQDSMLGFATHVYPGFKIGPHHRKLSKIFEDVIAGKKKRVIINIAPRMGKSEFSSYLFPAYFLGKFPDKKIIMGTHTASLSEDFGRRVRNLIESDEYQDLYPNTKIADDQKAAGKWSTGAGGSITQQVLAVLLPVAVLICLLLMILTLSRTLSQILDLPSILHGLGSKPVRCSVLCPEGRS